jgi:hypothetical protein
MGEGGSAADGRVEEESSHQRGATWLERSADLGQVMPSLWYEKVGEDGLCQDEPG